VGAELPVRLNLAATIAAFLEELVKFLLALSHGGLYPTLLGLLLFLVAHMCNFRLARFATNYVTR
jgi:hypothetical protein